MTTTYRQAHPRDVPEMSDLFLEAVVSLYARNNIATPLPPRAVVLSSYEHTRETGIFHLAQVDGRIAAIAGAVVRDHLWYLAAFWARPDLQRQGIGMPLLRRVWGAGKEAGASVFFTWSSIDTTTIASYLKLGMYPGYQILVFSGAPQQLPLAPPAYAVAPLDKSQAMDLDQVTLGTRRPADHRLWSDLWGLPGRQVLRGDEVVGYFYLNGGAIGPVAWKEPQYGEPVLILAGREASATAPQIRIAVPGINHLALRFALDSGLRLAGFAHLLTTAPFGRMEQYLPSGPGRY
jgi:GNAT superfamily N-acetyltransferase